MTEEKGRKETGLFCGRRLCEGVQTWPKPRESTGTRIFLTGSLRLGLFSACVGSDVATILPIPLNIQMVF